MNGWIPQMDPGENNTWTSSIYKRALGICNYKKHFWSRNKALFSVTTINPCGPNMFLTNKIKLHTARFK